MPRTSACADNLVLLGETIQMAADYIVLCQASLERENESMRKLAQDQVSPLRLKLANLDQSLRALKIRLAQASGQKLRKAKGASSS